MFRRFYGQGVGDDVESSSASQLSCIIYFYSPKVMCCYSHDRCTVCLYVDGRVFLVSTTDLHKKFSSESLSLLKCLRSARPSLLFQRFRLFLFPLYIFFISILTFPCGRYVEFFLCTLTSRFLFLSLYLHVAIIPLPPYITLLIYFSPSLFFPLNSFPISVASFPF